MRAMAILTSTAVLLVCAAAPVAAEDGGIDYLRNVDGVDGYETVQRVLDNGVAYTYLTAGYRSGTPKQMYGMRADGSIDDIKGDEDTGLYVDWTISGGTYQTIVGIPNATTPSLVPG